MITLIGNLKGGCGKSTVTFNLAVWLGVAGREVVAFDLDPQATLSDVAEVRLEEGYQPVVSVYRAEANPARVIQECSGEVLIDVGVSNLWSMRQAIGMADRIVVPVPPSQADVWSTQRFLRIVDETVSGTKRDTSPEVFLFVNRADTHPAVRESDEAEEALEMLPNATLIRNRLCQRTVYRRSFSEGLAVFDLEPRGKAAMEFFSLARTLYPDVEV